MAGDNNKTTFESTARPTPELRPSGKGRLASLVQYVTSLVTVSTVLNADGTPAGQLITPQPGVEYGADEPPVH